MRAERKNIKLRYCSIDRAIATSIYSKTEIYIIKIPENYCPARARKEKNSAPVSSLIDPNVINAYFQTINTDPNYSAPQLLEIPEGTRIPFLSIDTVYNFLRKQKRSSSGPDDLPYWFWKTYAAELAPAITEIFNASLKVGKFPELYTEESEYSSNTKRKCYQLKF